MSATEPEDPTEAARREKGPEPAGSGEQKKPTKDAPGRIWPWRGRAARKKAEQEWLAAKLKAIPSEAIEVARQAVGRELASLEALNNRLTATITFAGALLTLA